MDKVAIVILNWNGKHWLEKFLPDVIQHSQQAVVYVADNASTDDSITFLEISFPSVKLIKLNENHGFAQGYNEALAHVEAEYYVLLNSDVEVTENWLQPMLTVMADPNIAGCQPKVLCQKERSTFEYAGAAGGFIDRNYYPFCRGRILENREHDAHQYDSATEVFWATGACLMIRSQLYHEVGGLDGDFFAHMEEIDLCWRLKKKGHAFMVVPESTVYHVGGGALSYNDPRKTHLNFRNNLMMIIKNHEGMLFPKLYWRMTLDGVAACKYLVTFELKNFWAVFRAHMWNYGNLRRNLKKRKLIKQTSEKFNPKGMYRGNILWAYFFKGIRKFSDLNQRLFR